MAVRHGITDTDKHFIIDPVTRTIKNESGKLTLMRYDHHSERFTFEVPRYIDNHDMAACTYAEIHFINSGSGSSKISGIYPVDDLQVSPDDENVVICSWLISRNATQLVGSLNFVIRFVCTNDEGDIEYAWNTAIYQGISIANSIYNGESVIEEYVDILEQWRHDLYSEGLKIKSIEQTTTSTEDGGVNVVTVTLSDDSVSTFEIQNGSPGGPGASISKIERTAGNGSAGSTDTYTITLTDGTTSVFQVNNGKDGEDGSNIASIARSSGNGAPGTTDTYTVTLTDGTTSTFQVYNGANGRDGDGSGDMTAATYDPQGKRTDIFKYVDDAVSNADVEIDVDDSLSESSTNPVQNKVITAALGGKQANIIGVEIIETICEDVTFDDANSSYMLPKAITLDEAAFYYIDCRYYEENIESGVYDKYCLNTFSMVKSRVVKWGSDNDYKAITLTTTAITNNWRSSGDINVISIYKVKLSQIDPLLLAALHSTGYKTVAPGGYNATAEGHKNMALGYATHVEGRENYALGDYSHAEGAYNEVNGHASHVEGYGNVSASNYQHVEGKFNVEDNEDAYVHIVGNGTSNSDRKNAHTIDWDGNAWFAGSVSSKMSQVGNSYLVKNLGTLEISNYYDNLDEAYKDGTYHRMWRLRFPVYISISCRLRITLQSSYHSFNASGAMSKILNLCIEGEKAYNNTGYYDSLSSTVEQDFRISEAIYNSDVGAWEILIWQKHLDGNNAANITLEGWSNRDSEFNSINDITIEDEELTQDISYTAPCYNADTSNTRTVIWDETPVLESPHGKKLATTDDIAAAIAAAITGAIEGSY